MPWDILDKWRDEDDLPAPTEERSKRALPLSYPPDHDLYLRELYDEITALRAEVANLTRELTACRQFAPL